MRVISALALALLLSACAETEFVAHMAKKIPLPGEEGVAQTSYMQPSPLVANEMSEGVYKVGKPYEIDGKTYTPKEDYDYDETGIASWYGPGFHARKTANGEKFDQRGMTAAHRTLPLPSLVSVTNLDNGRAVVLRVNDRGPYARGRIIDVSERAAELLGFRNNGTAKVRVQVLEDESRAMAEAKKAGKSTAMTRPPPAQKKPVEKVLAQGAVITEGQGQLPYGVVQNPVEKTQIYVQAGAFTKEDNAVGLAQKLVGIAETSIQPATVRGQSFFRVRLGPIGSIDRADKILKKVVEAGADAARIIVD